MALKYIGSIIGQTFSELCHNITSESSVIMIKLRMAGLVFEGKKIALQLSLYFYHSDNVYICEENYF